MNCRTGWGVAIALLAVLAVGDPNANAQPNLIINGDVENDPEPDGFPNDWFHSAAGVSYPNDNGPSLPGVKALQIDALTGGAQADWRSSEAPAIAGGQYKWSFDYKFLEGATGGFRADLRFFDGPGAFEGEDAPFINASNIGQWQTSTRMFTAPPFTNSGGDNPLADNVLDIRLNSNIFGAGNGLVRFDNIAVQLIPEPAALSLLAIVGGFAAVRFGRRRKR
jgi:hypothetical protein